MKQKATVEVAASQSKPPPAQPKGKVRYDKKAESEFFVDNSALAGFTTERILYMAVRELIENSLDSCETEHILPRLSLSLKMLDPANDLWTITCEDNGIGVPSDKVPVAVCSFLTSGKYVEKQQRGLFGVGLKMIAAFSTKDTIHPLKVWSKSHEEEAEHQHLDREARHAQQHVGQIRHRDRSAPREVEPVREEVRHLPAAEEHDRGQLEILVDDKECMYVFDRGYLDYERFDRMTDDGYFFLSRLRKNTVIREVYDFKLHEESSVLSDQMVLIGTPQNRTENYFRLLKVTDSKGNELHLITNRFDLSAEEISEMYKSRWAIELFFKWIKQHLRIKKFYGYSEWAIQNQVFIALIVFCLHVLVQIETKSKRKTLQISRYLRAALWKSAHIWLRKSEGKTIP